MELKLNQIIFNYDINLEPIDFTLKSNKILSIIPNNTNILNLIKSGLVDGEIHCKRIVINKNNYQKKIKQLRNKIYICDTLDELYNITVLEDIKLRVGNYSKEKLNQLLIDFNLNSSILNKNYLELSDSQKVKILLICGLINNKDIVIFNNPTIYLDSSINKLIKEIKHIKKEKCILIISNNIEFLLQVSDEIIIKRDNKIISGDKYEILGNKNLMNEINFDLPNILSIINKIYETKKIKLKNRDNINDLIKDIYRNVK